MYTLATCYQSIIHQTNKHIPTYTHTQKKLTNTYTHTQGEMKVSMETDFASIRLGPGSLLYVKRPNRLSPRPVRITRARRQGGATSTTYLVSLESITSRAGASAFRYVCGCKGVYVCVCVVSGALIAHSHIETYVMSVMHSPRLCYIVISVIYDMMQGCVMSVMPPSRRYTNLQ